MHLVSFFIRYGQDLESVHFGDSSLASLLFSGDVMFVAQKVREKQLAQVDEFRYGVSG